ncbi:MAG: triose-phosphate isomerase [Bacteroidia bacterium]
MRNKIAAGNWKMNCTYNEAIQLATAIINDEPQSKSLATIMLAAPFLYLESLVKLIESRKHIVIAAQNCAADKWGAFTGEVSAPMLASIGVKAVIIGHSERRSIFEESNETLRKKVDQALENNLQPVFCCGEKLNERNDLRHFNVVEQQLWESLFHLDEQAIQKCVIAYEPVWAIGTGVTASPDQAQEMHQYIRSIIAEKFSKETASSVSILYGGSCNEKNAETLFALADVDGGLIGGASLKADSFLQIVKSF